MKLIFRICRIIWEQFSRINRYEKMIAKLWPVEQEKISQNLKEVINDLKDFKEGKQEIALITSLEELERRTAYCNDQLKLYSDYLCLRERHRHDKEINNQIAEDFYRYLCVSKDLDIFFKCYSPRSILEVSQVKNKYDEMIAVSSGIYKRLKTGLY